MESGRKRVMLDFELHLVGFGEECHHGGLVAGVSNVLVVDFKNAVAHAQLSSAGRCTTRNNLLRDQNVMLVKCS